MGAGALEMELKEQLAFSLRSSMKDNNTGLDIFEKSLEDLVCTLASNCGLDQNKVLANLRYLHHQKDDKSTYWGIDIESGGVGDVMEMGIWEPLQIKFNAFQQATKLACKILSIETMIFEPAKETEEEKQRRIAEELKRRKRDEAQIKSMRKNVQLEVSKDENFQNEISVLNVLGFAKGNK